MDVIFQDYEEAVQQGIQCNDWSKVVSLENNMIVPNMGNGIVVARSLDNLIELMYTLAISWTPLTRMLVCCDTVAQIKLKMPKV